MRKMKTKLALLNASLSSVALVTAGGCSARPPSQLHSAQIRKEVPPTDEQRLVAFQAAKPYATAGFVNAVIPERHVLQVQGIEPGRVAIGQLIEIVASNDLQNPIYASVFDRQQGLLQLRYNEDAGASRVPRPGDIAFCYLPKPAQPQQVNAPNQDRTASRFSAGTTTKPSEPSSGTEPSVVVAAEAPPRRAPKSADRRTAAQPPEEMKLYASAIQVVRRLLMAAGTAQSRPRLAPDPTEAAAAKRPSDNTIERQSDAARLVAGSGSKDSVSAPIGGTDPASPSPVNPNIDLRALIGVQLSGRRHVEVPKLPSISVQGYVHADGLEPMVLLQIGDGHKVYLVQRGTEIPIIVAGDVTPVGRNELTGLPGSKGTDTPAEATSKGAQESVVILKVQRITKEGVILDTGLAQTLTVR